MTAWNGPTVTIHAVLFALPSREVGSPTLGKGQGVATATRRFVSIATAAEYAALSKNTIRRYIAAGIITGYRIGTATVRVDLDELEAAMQPMASKGAGDAAA